MEQEGRKSKYLGVRITFIHYMQTINAAEHAGISITDFVLSLLLPAIKNFEAKPKSINNYDSDKQLLKERSDMPQVESNVIKESTNNGLDISPKIININGQDDSNKILEAALRRFKLINKN